MVQHGWYVHQGDVFANHVGPAVVTFMAPLYKGKLVWATNFLDQEHYTRYELTEKGLIVKSVPGGSSTKRQPVHKGAYYNIRIQWRSDGITVTIKDEVVYKNPSPGNFAEGKFGFIGNKEVQIQNFTLSPSN